MYDSQVFLYIIFVCAGGSTFTYEFDSEITCTSPVKRSGLRLKSSTDAFLPVQCSPIFSNDSSVNSRHRFQVPTTPTESLASESRNGTPA